MLTLLVRARLYLTEAEPKTLLELNSTTIHTILSLPAYLSLFACLSVCLSVCLFVYLSVCLCLCICLPVSVCLSVCVSFCLCVYLCICLSVCVSVCVCLSVCLSVCHRIKEFVDQKTLLSICSNTIFKTVLSMCVCQNRKQII